MTTDNPVDESTHQTALVLANASALTAAILRRVAGNDVSNSIGGSPLTQDLVHSLTTRAVIRSIESR